MKFKSIKFIFTIFSICLFSSCLSIGDKLTEDFNNIKIGVTTRQEIENKFGNPIRFGIDNGFKSYNYMYIKAMPFSDPKVKYFLLIFNENDTVKSYSFYSSFEDDKKIVYK
jgi:hypothetical protein